MALATQLQSTSDRLLRLAKLYESGMTSPLLERTIDKAFEYEAQVALQQLAEIESDLSGLEIEYAMSTEEFMQQYHRGALDDRMDFIDWASLAQMAEGLQDRIALLKDESVA